MIVPKYFNFATFSNAILAILIYDFTLRSGDQISIYT
jgi:hypothetical protein